MLALVALVALVVAAAEGKDEENVMGKREGVGEGRRAREGRRHLTA
jgi:hypothetical protein